MMLMCKDVHLLVSSGEVAELGWMRRIELKLHLLMCRHCRRYVEQMAALGRGFRALVHSHQAEPEQLNRLEEQIVTQCCGRHPDS
ncbi:MAG: hypothetical protein KAI25_16050 [Hyphomicrobiaceae bacterium]|nr:hypothetical protein [Hyphomicrobiaceae bacterium]